jgi:hypothetical protein
MDGALMAPAMMHARSGRWAFALALAATLASPAEAKRKRPPAEKSATEAAPTEDAASTKAPEKADEAAPEANPPGDEYGPALPPAPAPVPVQPMPEARSSSPQEIELLQSRGRAGHGRLMLGARFGGTFAEALGPLGASFLVGVEAGWAVPRLPLLGEGLVVQLDLGYTQPGASGSGGPDPRVPGGGGTYSWSVTEREIALGLTVLYRLPLRILDGRLVPYGGLGPRLVLLQSSTGGATGDGHPFTGYTERSTRAGFSLTLGADWSLGPGRIFAELGLVVLPFDHNATGPSDAGYLSLCAGYRVFLF